MDHRSRSSPAPPPDLYAYAPDPQGHLPPDCGGNLKYYLWDFDGTKTFLFCMPIRKGD